LGKNVWILNHYAKTPDMAGGTRHFDLSQELIKKGYKVTIFASGFDNNTKKYIKVHPKERYKIEDYNGVRFVWLNTFPYYGNDWRRLLNMISYGVRVVSVCREIEKPDVVIGSSVHPFAVLAAWWLARRNKAKFIFEVRDLWPQTAVEMGVIRATGISAKILYAWEKLMYKKAEKIIVLLPYAENYIKNKGINPKKIIWIPNGVDLERFDNSEPLNSSLKIFRSIMKYKDKFKVIYTGAHGVPNGLDIIVEAAALIKDEAPEIHFIFFGEGTEKERLKSKSKTFKLNNITFYDSVPKSSISSVLSLADCLIVSVPNFNIYNYGISLNKLFDYLASTKPIITAGNPKNNIIKDAKAGITIESENPEILAEGILKIQKMSEEEREQLGANGRAYVEKYHTSKVLAKKLEKIL
jgi:glycosyltransferase involved in cell wall biosynthesis